MFGQTFAVSDIPKVVVLAFLELLLSADNAVVLAVVSSALPEPLRKKALYIGFFSAFVFRALGILSIAFLLKFFWIQFLGAIYLIYLCLRHFVKKRKQETLMPKPIPVFWKTVLMIELFDLAFAIDSIVSGVAFIGTSPANALFHPKLWIVYLGGMLGVFGIRYTAYFFSRLMKRFPRLEHSAYAMIGLVGIKLAVTATQFTIPYFDLLFWSLLSSLFLFGFTEQKSHE